MFANLRHGDPRGLDQVFRPPGEFDGIRIGRQEHRFARSPVNLRVEEEIRGQPPCLRRVHPSQTVANQQRGHGF